METSVSIVTWRWMRLSAALRWNSQPDPNTTGVVSTSATHCQPSNMSDGTMEMRSVGTVSTVATTS